MKVPVMGTRLESISEWFELAKQFRILIMNNS